MHKCDHVFGLLDVLNRVICCICMSLIDDSKVD